MRGRKRNFSPAIDTQEQRLALMEHLLEQGGYLILGVDQPLRRHSLDRLAVRVIKRQILVHTQPLLLRPASKDVIELRPFTDKCNYPTVLQILQEHRQKLQPVKWGRLLPIAEVKLWQEYVIPEDQHRLIQLGILPKTARS